MEKFYVVQILGEELGRLGGKCHSDLFLTTNVRSRGSNSYQGGLCISTFCRSLGFRQLWGKVSAMEIALSILLFVCSVPLNNVVFIALKLCH